MAVISWVRNWWGKSLRNRLLASSIATMLLFLVLQGYLSFRIGRTGVLNEVIQRNDKLATIVAKDVDGQLDNIWSNVRILTYQLQASDGVLPLEAQSMLALRLASPLTYRALYLFDSEGHLVIHLTDPLEDLLAIGDVLEIVNRGPIPLTNEVSTAQEALMTTGNLFVSPVSIVGADQIPVVYVAMPVLAKQGQSRRSIVAEVDLRGIWRRVDRVSVGRAGRAFVVSRSGMIIAHPDRSYIGRALPAELEQVLAGYQGQTEYSDPVSKRIMLASYSPVGRKFGWGIVVEQERDEAFVPVNRIASTALVVLLVAVGIAIAVSTLIARNITRPIQRLEEATETIGRTGDLTQNIAVEGQDEVSHLAATFNRMIASLREAERKLKQYSGELEELVEERTAELETSNKELESFTYSISHDLKIPLRAIDGFSQILLQDHHEGLSKEEKRILGVIRGNTAKMAQLIEDLLNFSRLGRKEVRKTKINMGKLAKDVFEQLKSAAPKDKLKMKMNSVPSAYGDESLVREVLDNLISNAIKFSKDEETSVIEVGGKVEDKENTYYVKDNGVGFDMKYSDKLFGVFQRLHSQEEFEGTGVGLAIVQRIVHRHGGRVWAEGKVNKGATFYFTLPSEKGGVKR